MNLVLRMIRGPHVGACRVLQVGQSAFIGSSDVCDFPVAPAVLGSPQFLIRCSQNGCQVQNVFHAVRLMVNGVFTTRKQLSDGDVISVGTCEFIVKIRGLISRLQKLRIPLVGTREFNTEFTASLNARRPDHTVQETTRATIHPSFWSDSVRMAHCGRGIPALSVIRRTCGDRPSILIVDANVVERLSFLHHALCNSKQQQTLTAVSSNDGETRIYMLEGLTDDDQARALRDIWTSGSAMLVLPLKSSAVCRDTFVQSSLWQNRSVAHVARTLIEGSLTLREGVFGYLDQALLPTASGWMLLSSTRMTDSDKSQSATAN